MTKVTDPSPAYRRRPSEVMAAPAPSGETSAQYPAHPAHAPDCPVPLCHQDELIRDLRRRIIVLETDGRRTLMVVEGLDASVGHLREGLIELRDILREERRARDERDERELSSAKERLDEAKQGRDWVGMIASAVLSSLVPAILLAGLWLLSRPGLILPHDPAQEQRR